MSWNNERVRQIEERKALVLFSAEEHFGAFESPSPDEVEILASFAEDLCQTKAEQYGGSEFTRTYFTRDKDFLSIVAGDNKPIQRPETWTPPRVSIDGIRRGIKTTLLGNEFMARGIYQFRDEIYIEQDTNLARILRAAWPLISTGSADRLIRAYRPASTLDIQQAKDSLLTAVNDESFREMSLVQRSRARRMGDWALKALISAGKIPL